VSVISAQISLYPLRQPSIGDVIEHALAVCDRHDVEVIPGPTSTVIRGSADQVFGALRDAFDAAGSHGDAVLVAIVSNACPVEPSTAVRDGAPEPDVSKEVDHGEDRHHHL
jgi:uncharacterized protein YqgV (UPF0045/DUF77 family)